MFLLLVDFPNEAQGIDHLHIQLGDHEAVVAYLEWFRLWVGAHTYEVTEQRTCPRCEQQG